MSIDEQEVLLGILSFHGSTEVLEFIAKVYLNERSQDSIDIMRIVERNKREFPANLNLKTLTSNITHRAE